MSYGKSRSAGRIEGIPPEQAQTAAGFETKILFNWDKFDPDEDLLI